MVYFGLDPEVVAISWNVTDAASELSGEDGLRDRFVSAFVPDSPVTNEEQSAFFEAYRESLEAFLTAYVRSYQTGSDLALFVSAGVVRERPKDDLSFAAIASEALHARGLDEIVKSSRFQASRDADVAVAELSRKVGHEPTIDEAAKVDEEATSRILYQWVLIGETSLEGAVELCPSFSTRLAEASRKRELRLKGGSLTT